MAQAINDSATSIILPSDTSINGANAQYTPKSKTIDARNPECGLVAKTLEGGWTNAEAQRRCAGNKHILSRASIKETTQDRFWRWSLSSGRIGPFPRGNGHHPAIHDDDIHLCVDLIPQPTVDQVPDHSVVEELVRETKFDLAGMVEPTQLGWAARPPVKLSIAALVMQ
jgi:hypothetical protein